MNIQELMRTHPDAGRSVSNPLVECIERCFSCAQSCTACADACLAERSIDSSGISRTPGVKETKRMMLLRIDASSVKVLKVPMQLEKREEEPSE